MNATTKPGATLTYREGQVLRFLSAGMSVPQVAKRLNLADCTVSQYLYSARIKSGARTNYQMFAQFGRQSSL
ncbi:helix-turn-helix transcriptional regulator [Streptomyces sp. NPDC058471]|uniref:helix-turn-helix domain-containing protein n=1 Tax=Streptomyces sp. NPDC058471 TaxID=3346516 RepID=UPI0036695FD5